MLTRLLFDSGSQRTYITENLRAHLRLKTVRKERVVIKTFGRNDSEVKNLDVVRFNVLNKVDNEVVC